MENILVELLLRAPYREDVSRNKRIECESCRLMIRQYRKNYFLAWKAFGFIEMLRAN